MAGHEIRKVLTANKSFKRGGVQAGRGGGRRAGRKSGLKEARHELCGIRLNGENKEGTDKTGGVFLFCLSPET